MMNETLQKNSIGPHLFMVMCSSLLVLFIIWAYFGKLDIVSVADGKVIPSSKVKSIQHLEGGIIKGIHVKEGERVKKGQPLVYLEEISSGASVEELKVRINSLSVDIARLEQEEKCADTVSFPDELNKNHPELVKQAEKIFHTRLLRYQSEIGSQNEKINQRIQDIKQIETRLKNNKQGLKLLEEQIDISKELLKDQLATQYNHLNLLRELTKLKSKIEEDSHALDRAKSSQNEASEKLKGIKHSFKEIAEKELKKARQELDEFTQRLVKFKDSFKRSVIRSPIDGFVKSLYFVTVGGVIKPGMTIVDIVPASDRLIIEAHLPIGDIGYVQAGQEALIRLASPDARRFGEIKGTVINVSPDAFNTRQGRTYYSVLIETRKDHFKRKNLTYKLYPGILVMASIHTGQRTILEYLLDPFLNTLGNSLKER